jgi:hypothetical protein
MVQVCWPLTASGGGCSIAQPSDGVIGYAINFTVVPHGSLNYLTVWPTGGPQPLGSGIVTGGQRSIMHGRPIPSLAISLSLNVYACFSICGDYVFGSARVQGPRWII